MEEAFGNTETDELVQVFLEICSGKNWNSVVEAAGTILVGVMAQSVYEGVTTVAASDAIIEALKPMVTAKLREAYGVGDRVH
jgi:hypothetical protein